MAHKKLIKLPQSGDIRWVKSRKRAVIEAIEKGILTRQKACEKYHLSIEELRSWETLFMRHGVDALRVTHLKEYRHVSTPDA